MTSTVVSHDDAGVAAWQRTQRLQLAYKRVFGGGAKKEDRLLVLADLEGVTNARRNMLRETEHATIYEMGKFSVWQRIDNMRSQRPADARTEFRVSVERTGGLSNEQEADPGARPEAGRGVAEQTDD